MPWLFICLTNYLTNWWSDYNHYSMLCVHIYYFTETTQKLYPYNLIQLFLMTCSAVLSVFHMMHGYCGRFWMNIISIGNLIEIWAHAPDDGLSTGNTFEFKVQIFITEHKETMPTLLLITSSILINYIIFLCVQKWNSCTDSRCEIIKMWQLWKWISSGADRFDLT